MSLFHIFKHIGKRSSDSGVFENKAMKESYKSKKHLDIVKGFGL
jgi:hypothetical protein